MAVFELDLRNLLELDGGRVSEAFLSELKRIAVDLEDRPGDDKERKVTLEALIKPVVDESGALDSAYVKFHVTSSVPKRRSKVYSMGVRHGGKFVFNDLSDDDIHQKTID